MGRCSSLLKERLMSSILNSAFNPADVNILPVLRYGGLSLALMQYTPSEGQFTTNSTADNIVVVAQGAGSFAGPNRSQMNTEINVALHNPAVQGAQGSPQVNASNQVQTIAGNPNA